LELGLCLVFVFLLQGIGFVLCRLVPSRYECRMTSVGRVLSYGLALLPYTAVINNLEILSNL
jgi:hypothetical protein